MEAEYSQSSQRQPQTYQQPTPPPIVENIESNPTQKPASPQDREEKQTIPAEPTKIVIIGDERKDKHAKIANIIGAISLFLAAIVFVVTFLLFKETQKATGAAIQSATAAENTFREQKFHDSITRYRDSVKMRDDSITQQRNFIIDSTSRTLEFEFQRQSLKAQSKSIDAQIQSLRETQRQFEVINKPYLQIENFDTLRFRKDEQPVLSYLTTNLGNQPAKIIKAYVVSFTNVAGKNILEEIRDYEAKGEPYKDNNGYVIKESPVSQRYYWRTIMTEPYFTNIISGKNSIYLFGKMIYIDLVTHRRRLYKFAVEMSITNGISYKFLYSDNVDIN